MQNMPKIEQDKKQKKSETGRSERFEIQISLAFSLKIQL